MIAAVEIHNKPLFPYRYEVCTLLVINAWELLLKAYIYKFQKKVKLFHREGTTKPFGECLACVSSNLGKEFQTVRESLERLYEYRNSIAHFYSENIDVILWSLMKANVAFYVEFISKHFGVDLANETSLVLLPIGFKKPYSPLDFLFNKTSLEGASEEVKRFVGNIVQSSRTLQEAGIDESILVEFRMSVVNEKRIKNADIIAGISSTTPMENTIVVENVLGEIRLSDSPTAKEVKIDEESLFRTIFTERYADVLSESRRRFVDFKKDHNFNKLMAGLKKDPQLARTKYLDEKKPRSGKKDYFSKAIYERLAEHYTSKPNDSASKAEEPAEVEAA